MCWNSKHSVWVRLVVRVWAVVRWCSSRSHRRSGSVLLTLHSVLETRCSSSSCWWCFGLLGSDDADYSTMKKSCSVCVLLCLHFFCVVYVLCIFVFSVFLCGVGLTPQTVDLRINRRELYMIIVMMLGGILGFQERLRIFKKTIG